MKASTPLADRFLAARSPSATHEPPEPERIVLDQLLREALDGARGAWPGVVLGDEDFVSDLAARLPDGVPVADALAASSVRDLYLASACARGSPPAIAAFEARYGQELVLAVERARIPGVAADEVAQAVRASILVGDGERPPRIAQYQGRGDLSGWLRVAAVREALMSLRGRRREVPLRDGHLAALVHDDADPELAHLKGLYAAEFRAAFSAALTTLESRDRNLLRYHYLERLSLDRLAAMYQVHRVSISRWIADARERILQATVTALRQRIQVSDSEFDSLVLLLRSRVDVSVRGLLRDSAAPR